MTSDKTRQISSLLRELTERRMSGQEMTDEEIIRQNSDLMPELAEALQKHRLIQFAREQAKHDSDDRVAFGDYVLLEPLGRGGMGVVYRANQFSLNREVAVKMIRDRSPTDEQRVRFRREAEAAAALKHPNIVPVYEVGDFNGDPYFSMEFVEGGSLTQIVTSRSWSQQQAAECVKKVAEAIQYAHECNILHRDIKPSNVLLDTHGEPRITDFGLAKRLDDDSSLTRTAQVLGSPNYMSPEQAGSDQDRIGCHTDIYSLGALLYALLSGIAPFNESPAEVILRKVKEDAPTPLRELVPGLDNRLERICQRCLEKEPEQRYPDARSLVDDLNRYLANQRLARNRWGLKRFSKTQFAAFGLIVALFSFLFLWTSGAKPEPFVVVTVPYPGASPEEVESGVVSPIEKALLGMDGITHITSRCTEGEASVSIILDPAVSIDQTITASKAAVDAITRFPDLAEFPEWTAALNSRRAIAWLVFQVDEQTTDSDLIETMQSVEQTRKLLSGLPEVGMVQAIGMPLHEIEVVLEASRLQRFELGAEDIWKLVNDHHGAIAITGSVEPAETPASLDDLVDQLEGLPVRESGGRTIFLHDVASVSMRVSMSASIYEHDSVSATAAGATAGAPFHAILIGIWPAAGFEHSDVVTAVSDQLSDVMMGWNDERQGKNGISLVNLTAVQGFHLNLYTPGDAPPDFLPACVDALARRIRDIEGVEHVICMDGSTSLQGVSDSELVVVTSSAHPEISESISSAIRELHPVTVRVEEIGVPQQKSAGIEMKILGPDRESVWKWARGITDKLQSQTEIRNLVIDDTRNQTVLAMDETRKNIGLPSEEISQGLRKTDGLARVIKVRKDNSPPDVQISVCLDQSGWEPNAAIPDNPEVILRSGHSVNLDSGMNKWVIQPRDLQRYDGLPMVRITAQSTPSLTIADAKERLLNAAEAARKEIGLSKEFRIVN